jgi:flagellar protein FlaG
MGIAITAVGNGYPSSELAGEYVPHALTHPRPADAQAGETKAADAGRAAVDIDSTTADLERISLAFNKKLRFVVDRELEQVIVKVIDPATDKVIKELPPEELQRLHLKIKEMIGLLFDERA